MKHLPIILTSLIFAVIAWWVWPKSTDAYVDFGREIYVGWRVSEGELPTRDFAYFNGPLSPLWNGMIFRLFPPSVTTLKLANTAVAGACTVLMFVLVSRWTNQWTAACACILFSIASAFSALGYEPYFSLLSPYSHEMSHGLLLLLSVFLLISSHRRWSAAALGCCVGLSALTKPEIFLACLSAVICAGILRAWTSRQINWNKLALFAVAAALPLVACFAYLAIRSNIHTAMITIAGAWKYLGNKELVSGVRYQALRGTDHTSENLSLAMLWTLAWSVIVASWMLLSLARRAVAMIAVVTLTIVAFVALWNRIDFLGVSRPLALLLPLFSLAFIPQTWRRDGSNIEVISVCAACTMLVMKVVLDAKLSHYGFVLASPGFILMLAIIAGPLANLWKRDLIVAAAGASVFMLGLSIWLIQKNVEAMQYRLIELPVAANDRFAVEPVRGQPLAELLEDLRRSHDPSRTVAVVPVGAMVNFLIRERNPTGQLTILPIDLLMFGEGNVLNDFKQHPPDLIVLMHTDSSVHGARFFGQDYAVDLAAWIRDNYRPLKQYGALPFAGNAFGILVMGRKPS